MRERIGIFGGTFNPVHHGHLILAERAREELAVDRMLLLPSGAPPHKSGPDLAPAEDRLEMVRLATASSEGLGALDLEVRREGTTYTIDTLRELAELHPEATVFFLVGADSIPELITWREWRSLFDLAHFVTLRRPGFDLDTLPSTLREVLPVEARRDLERYQLSTPHIEISSTDIRARVRSDRSIRFLVPDAVRDFILQHGLYRPSTDSASTS